MHKKENIFSFKKKKKSDTGFDIHSEIMKLYSRFIWKIWNMKFTECLNMFHSDLHSIEMSSALT